MPNILIQDLTAIINGTSRNGAKYDTVHVETLITTDQPIPQNLNWYVPNGCSVPKEISDLFKANHIEMYPQTEENILKGTEDILEQAKSNSLPGTEIDASKLLLRAVMKLSSLVPVEGTQNCYIVSYDYKIYPAQDNSFEFKVVLPFDGLTMINAKSLVQTTVTAPVNSKINSVKSYAADLSTNKEVTQETVVQTTTKRPIVTFQYKQDPIFVINYNY
ncbi:hypothetical protein [Clostridium tyrobutyricum]|uniref:hypothetical protein n=1 Tax=Clostridium tyrobutyricum TaxID=1519 RepID=UPI002B22125C|nr:hypothetical protein [Clostridium tyrobutyricum]MEA5008247.1 hypothetical protein [Clostridium tyrobutyricum]